MTATMSFEMNDTGKSTLFSQTVKNYSQKLFGFIKGKVKNLEDAEDVLQDVWYQLSNLTSINEIESISGWLYSVARNRITDFYRKRKNLSLEEMTYENEDGELHIKDILLLDTNNDPELKLFKDLFWKELEKALNELPENQKQVFILNEIEDRTLQQIADEQNENIKTIISRKGYAIKHLRNRLEPLYKEFYQS